MSTGVSFCGCKPKSGCVSMCVCAFGETLNMPHFRIRSSQLNVLISAITHIIHIESNPTPT